MTLHQERLRKIDFISSESDLKASTVGYVCIDQQEELTARIDTFYSSDTIAAGDFLSIKVPASVSLESYDSVMSYIEHIIACINKNMNVLTVYNGEELVPADKWEYSQEEALFIILDQIYIVGEKRTVLIRYELPISPN